MYNKSFLVFLALLFLPFCLSAQESQLEKSQKIDEALNYYYNGKTELAQAAAEELLSAFPDDAFMRELKAEITWQELEKKVTDERERNQKIDKTVDYKKVRENKKLSERFYLEAYKGLVLTQSALDINHDDIKNTFLRGMLLARLGGFMAKFESSIRSYAKADELTAESIGFLRRSMELDPSLCSAKYIFALSKYIMVKKSSESLRDYLGIRFFSKVYAELGSDFNFKDVLMWARESMNCQSNYYWTKDVEIDKQLLYQEILVHQAGKMDEEVLPVLLSLRKKFPENRTVKDNLFLVESHLHQKKRK